MSFIRPEARAALMRWRGVIASLALALLGLFWVLDGHGLIRIAGWVLLALGAVLAVVSWQRTRFGSGGGGPGVVQVDEGQITYMGPLTGGAVAARDLERLTLDPTTHPAHWVLLQPGQPPLHIPVNAEGGEALFDVFATLPGLRTERMLAQLQGRSLHPVVIWERTPSRPGHLRLN